MVIGNNVGLGSHGHYGAGLGGLEIGDDTIIGNYVSFHPENHIFSELNMPIRQQGVYGKGIKIGKNCWIGAKATFLDGTVIDVKSDNIVGSIVEIRHTNNLISLYQSLGEVNVKVDDKVVQGQIIGKSGKTNLNTKVDNNLHFELYYNGEIVNPNDYFDKNIKDL